MGCRTGMARRRIDPGPKESIRPQSAHLQRVLLIESSGTTCSVFTIFTLPHPLRNRQLLRLGVATHPVRRFRPIECWKKFQY